MKQMTVGEFVQRYHDSGRPYMLETLPLVVAEHNLKGAEAALRANKHTRDLAVILYQARCVLSSRQQVFEDLQKYAEPYEPVPDHELEDGRL
jgi:TPP-dependent indolepyruvate ferredoxin oxidoreductase alpha subunit